MDPRQLIDGQFDRAVEIVQGLPKTGPIQTGYEEKLTMYSLYKQATVGNVKTPRPGMWDMLGRAKWDEWAKHKDLDTYEAKSLYVDALLKVLKKYSDRTVAKDLVRELESYGVNPPTVSISRTVPKPSTSVSSGSTASEEQATRPAYPLMTPPIDVQTHQPNVQIPPPASGELTFEEESDYDEQAFQVVQQPVPANRPQSSRSSGRYRTPMAGSLAMSPPLGREGPSIPPTQPHPGFETPSAFAETSSPSMPSSIFPTTSSYVERFSQSPHAGGPTTHMYDSRHRHSHPVSPQHYGPAVLVGQPTLEHAIERVQGHLAALTERLELLESNTRQYHRSSASLATGGSTPNWASVGRYSPDGSPARRPWDLDDLGMWSLVLNPMVRGITVLRELSVFVLRSENRSPAFVVIRRLFFDVSFLLCVVTVIRMVWRRSGIRRREIRAALRVLWRAILGRPKERTMVDRGV